MFKRNKWNLLYLLLGLIILFSIIAVPKIVIDTMNKTKDQIITVTQT
jgi:hypothetical protein